MGYRRLPVLFEGRIGRARYWIATLVILGLTMAALLLLTVICDAFGIGAGPLTIDIIGISASTPLMATRRSRRRCFRTSSPS